MKFLKNSPGLLNRWAMCLDYKKVHGLQISEGSEEQKLLFFGRVKCYKDFVCNLFCKPVNYLQNYFSNKKTSFVALFNIAFEIALLVQLTSVNSCLSMPFI